jgi:hypothetical protein
LAGDRRYVEADASQGELPVDLVLVSFKLCPFVQRSVIALD